MTALVAGLLFSGTAVADHHKIKSAMSAGPDSLTADATIKAWDGTVLREGSNGWICLPDNADTPGADPWCINDAWGNFLEALTAKKDPSYDTVGVAYMLAGDTPVSNTDPFATEFTNAADWVDNLGALPTTPWNKSSRTYPVVRLIPNQPSIAGPVHRQRRIPGPGAN